MPKKRKSAAVRELNPLPETSVTRLYDASGGLIHSFPKGEAFPDFSLILKDIDPSAGYVSVDMTDDAGMWSELEEEEIRFHIKSKIVGNTRLNIVDPLLWGDALPKTAWMWFELGIYEKDVDDQSAIETNDPDGMKAAIAAIHEYDAEIEKRRVYTFENAYHFPQDTTLSVYCAAGRHLHTFAKGDPFPNLNKVTEDWPEIVEQGFWIAISQPANNSTWEKTEIAEMTARLSRQIQNGSAIKLCIADTAAGTPKVSRLWLSCVGVDDDQSDI